MSEYEKAYRDGYRAGSCARDREDGGRAGWVCIAVSVCSCTAFAIIASVIQLLHLG